MQQRYALCARLSTNAVKPSSVQRDALFLQSGVTASLTVDDVIGFRLRLPYSHRAVLDTGSCHDLIPANNHAEAHFLYSIGKARADCGPGGDESPPGKKIIVSGRTAAEYQTIKRAVLRVRRGAPPLQRQADALPEMHTTRQRNRFPAS